MEMLSFYLENILRPVFEESQLARKDLSKSDDDGDDEEKDNNNISNSNVERISTIQSVDQDNRSVVNSEPMSRSSSRRRNLKSVSDSSKRTGHDILDLQGPKLIEGCRVWILFYQLVGQLNWLGVPFYVSIIYKILVLFLIGYVFYNYLIREILDLSILDLNYRNPIFIFISFLAITSTAFNTVLAFYTNLFNLCPLFKVLTTPRLCFISEQVQHIIGTKTTSFIFIFYAYHSCLLLLLVHTDLFEFVNNFNIGRFVLFLFCSICFIYHLIGLSHLDFYIRACFASWLIALKSNLEYRFAHLHHHQRMHNMRALAAATAAAADMDDDEANNDAGDDDAVGDMQSAGLSSRPISVDSTSASASAVALHRKRDKVKSWRHSGQHRSSPETIIDEFKHKYKIVTLDEIQKNLNTVDDHLEVWRSIQTSSLVLITLNAFLTNGAMLLLAYNLLANKGDYYHGLLLILLVTNYTIVIFFCYIGDSWLYYALSSFVQTVEDEYFLQGGDELTSASVANNTQQPATAAGAVASSVSMASSRRGSWATLGAASAGSQLGEPAELSREHQLLLIKKKDVLFCREFLHQFENHLATPWSKLNVKVHLRMVGTFVTLIAAQIIFDHEH